MRTSGGTLLAHARSRRLKLAEDGWRMLVLQGEPPTRVKCFRSPPTSRSRWMPPRRRIRSATALASLLAAAPILGVEPCSRECSCMARASASQLHQTHRAARQLAVGIDRGAFDNQLLENAQTEVGNSVNAIWRLRGKCSPAGWVTACNASAPVQVRRSCACRPSRLLNITTTVQRRLDDAAAGVLFGDSEQNMLELASATPPVLHALSRVGSELDRLGRLACRQEL